MRNSDSELQRHLGDTVYDLALSVPLGRQVALVAMQIADLQPR